jgi:hypothetical protein
MFLFPPTALYNGVVTETNLPLLLLRSTKCDDENREAHAASPPKGMRNKREREREREREETKRDPHSNSTKIKTSNLADRRTQKKGIVKEKNKKRRRITNAFEIEEEIHPQAPEKNPNSRSNQGTQRRLSEKTRGGASASAGATAREHRTRGCCI